MEILGRAAIVTGGASGLGEATARMLVRAGARVAIVDLDEARVRSVAGEVGAVGIALDVTDAAAAEAAVSTAHTANGPARILVNCAGIAPPKRIVGKGGPMPLGDFARVIEVNLIGSFNMLRLAAAEMAAAEPLGADGERGVIVNTASVAAFEGQVGQAAYAASKGGIVALTLPAARELARYGVRVMAIAPGIFRTPMMAGLPEAVQQSLAATVPYPPRLGTAEEYALLVQQIVANPMLNGETIRLDGALRMAPQ